MKVARPIAVAAVLAAASCASIAAAGVDFTLPVCDSQDSLHVAVTGEKHGKAMSEVFDGLRAAGKLACAQPGPLPGTWVLDGNKRAMLVGILPVGVDAQSYLQVWNPRFQLIGPLRVERLSGGTQAPSN